VLAFGRQERLDSFSDVGVRWNLHSEIMNVVDWKKSGDTSMTLLSFFFPLFLSFTKKKTKLVI